VAGIRPYVDHVGVGYTNLEYMDVSKAKLRKEEEERIQFLKSQQIKFGKHPECPEVFDKVSVNFDGSVSACCFDYDNEMIIGNLKESSIAQIWEAPAMRHYRTLLANMQHDQIGLCSKCYDVYKPEGPAIG
jgi:radical SAM protein with 4Fe4S-binding SPASM domain